MCHAAGLHRALSGGQGGLLVNMDAAAPAITVPAQLILTLTARHYPRNGSPSTLLVPAVIACTVRQMKGVGKTWITVVTRRFSVRGRKGVDTGHPCITSFQGTIQVRTRPVGDGERGNSTRKRSILMTEIGDGSSNTSVA
jgi:hypothetical protein